MRVLMMLLMLTLPASAANFSAKILDLNGKPVVDDGKEVTLGDVAVRALMSLAQDEQSLAGEEKFKRFALAMRLKDGGEVAVSAEDIAMLKKLIGKLYTPLVVGRAFPLLDPSEKAAAK